MAASVGYNSAPRSLTISPNLEALLEHDEKIRQLKMVDVPIFGGDAVAQWSTVSVVGDVVDYGLPPPPRRRRPATAPNSPASDGGRLWSTSSPTSSAQSPTLFFTRSPGAAAPTSSTSDNNPFINPAPSQEDLRRMHRPAPLAPRPSSFTGAYTDRRPEARSQLAGSSLSPPPPPPPHRPVMRVPTHVPHTSLPEKLEGGHGLGIATGSETSGHPAGHRKTESEPAVQQMKTTVTQTPFRLRERARLKGKLLKLKGTSCNRLRALSEDSPLQAQAIQGVTLTYEEPGKSRELEIVSLDINSSAAGIPRRPGVGSHARRHKSSPSVGSGSSTLDRGALSPHALTVTAAHSPLPAAVHDANTPFTIDPRSVIDTPAQPTMPGDARTQSRRQSGQSFIDFSPVFEDAPALDLQSRPEKTAARQAISPLDIPSQAEPAVSRSASLKPPLPTAPKPTFHRALSVSRSANRSKSASRPEDNMLPPTTNNLSAEERAGLIRRNRKHERQTALDSPQPG
ncbi:hypothetical protein BD626DRAFT_501271 [Schizophyllum amplum]|uniref:Uncharacterized protein n=1 Tax=Schizophyllum amplum TaxID=97359 RepID=A0A550C9P7_9AGAR|nr:hypothetical protein BD626DRAFT_501271 [Auriculariopsis ampla]